MPLIQGKSKKSFGKNVSKEMEAGKPQKQALAIAFSIKRKNAGKKKMADGGSTDQSQSSQPSISSYGSSGSSSSSSAPSSQGQNSSQSDNTTKALSSIRNAFGHAKGGDVKKPKLGSGKRFSNLEHSLSHEKGIENPAALAASIGRKKYGSEKMAKLSEHGKKMMYDGGMADVNDQDELTHNKGQKSLSDSDWSSDVTVRQAQRPSETKLSRPTGVYSNRLEDEDHLQESFQPESPELDRPLASDEEIDSDRSGPEVPDMEDEHSNGRKPYTEGGEVELSDDQPADEEREMNEASRFAAEMARRYYEGGMMPKDNGIEEDERSDESDMIDKLGPSGSEMRPASKYESEYHSGPSVSDMEDEHSNGEKPYVMAAKGGMAPKSIAEAIRMKKKMMSDGGEVDIDSNEMEQPNSYYARNEDAALKENYDSDMDGVSQPMDSNMDSRVLSDEDEHDGSMVSKIRAKMKSKRDLR